jgi:hypothetical protein
MERGLGRQFGCKRNNVGRESKVIFTPLESLRELQNM